MMASQLESDDSGDEKSDFNHIGSCTWRKLRKEHQKVGFIDGKYVGAEKSKIDGFAKGYETGFNASLHIALLKGVICAAGVYVQSSGNEQRSQEARQLKEEVEKLQCEYIEHVSSQSVLTTDFNDECANAASVFYSQIKALKEKTIQLCNDSGCPALQDLVSTL